MACPDSIQSVASRPSQEATRFYTDTLSKDLAFDTIDKLGKPRRLHRTASSARRGNVGSSDSGDKSADEAQLREQLAKMGLLANTETPFDPEPEVDRPLLEKLARRELDKSEAALLWQFVLAFPSWNKAFRRILEEQFPPEGPPPK